MALYNMSAGTDNNSVKS